MRVTYGPFPSNEFPFRPLYSAKVVGLISVDGSSRPAEGESEESLHATLCRIAGIHRERQPNPVTLPHRKNPISSPCHLPADVKRLQAELAEEYTELAGSWGS